MALECLVGAVTRLVSCIEQWHFVVGLEGLDCNTWTFDPQRAEPEVLLGMLVHGRNAKRLSELLNTSEAQLAGLAPAEVVALRLYTGRAHLWSTLVLHMCGCAGASCP